jgi:hypothetical protein
MMIQSMSFCLSIFTKQITKAQVREKLFLIAENLSQSIMVFSLESDYGALFHQDNVSPFQFQNDLECTYPINLEDFYSLFFIKSDESDSESTSLQVICAKKEITLTSKPIFQYILYIYQNQGNEINYGYSTFCQTEK